jgi:hypothetical protein
MTRADVFSISLKLAAVYVWIQALLTLAQVGYFVRQLYEPGQPAFFVLAPIAIPAALLASLGVGLFRGSSFFAERLEGGHVSASREDAAGVGALGLRIAAILVVERAFERTAVMFSQLRIARIDGHWGVLWTELVIVVMLSATALGLFLGADGIAPRLFGKAAPRHAEPPRAVIQAVAFSVVGVWVLAAVFPDCIRLLENAGQDWTRTVGTLLRVGLGVGLFFGGTALAALWLRVRTAVVETKTV